MSQAINKFNEHVNLLLENSLKEKEIKELQNKIDKPKKDLDKKVKIDNEYNAIVSRLIHNELSTFGFNVPELVEMLKRDDYTGDYQLTLPNCSPITIVYRDGNSCFSNWHEIRYDLYIKDEYDNNDKVYFDTAILKAAKKYIGETYTTNPENIMNKILYCDKKTFSDLYNTTERIKNTNLLEEVFNTIINEYAIDNYIAMNENKTEIYLNLPNHYTIIFNEYCDNLYATIDTDSIKHHPIPLSFLPINNIFWNGLYKIILKAKKY